MTQALNLALFANKLNASGQTDNTGLQNSSIVINTTSPITGGATTALGGSLTIAHANSGVTATSYTNANITVNAQGHITAASNGSSGQIQSVLYTSGTNTWTAPAGVTRVKVVCIGGGGSASGASGCAGIRPYAGGFGGAGIGVYTVVAGTGYTVTVGAGGAGGTAGQPGVTGGTSSFGSLISATGGVRGLYNNAGGGQNGTCSLGTVRNGNMTSDAFAPFTSTGAINTNTTALTTWTTSLLQPAGAGGVDLGGFTGGGSVGGLVYIEYIG